MTQLNKTNHDQILSDVNSEIKVIASLVADILTDEFGNEFLENLNLARKSLERYYKENTFENLNRVITKFNEFNPYWTVRLIRAYTLYFHVANVVEHIYRIDDLSSDDYSIEKLDLKIKKLIQNDAQMQKNLINLLDIKLVFTAHPTEAARPEILNQINNLHEIIKKRHDERINGIPFSQLSFQDELKESAKVIIQTDELRQLKPSPVDEAINNLFYIDKVVYEEIPKLNMFIKQLVEGNKLNLLFSPIKIGTWIGGDRDGNPNVNHELTDKIIDIQYKRNKRRIINVIEDLIDNLSQSIHIVTYSKELSNFIDLNIQVQKDYINYSKYEEEPYRLGLSFILNNFINDKYDIKSLIGDLNIILDSLVNNRGTKKEIKKISLLIESLKIGGFVTAEMDIREDSEITTNAAKEIIKNLFKENISISEALKNISKNNKKFDLINLNLSPQTLEVLNTFKSVKKNRNKYGINSVNTWIVAMTSSADDLLSIAFLSLITSTISDYEDLSKFRIVPLLETIDDLKNANEILNKFWSEIYTNKSVVEVMIGYSDSNKDGGIIKSQWNLYSSQKEIYKLSKKLNLDLVLFHGRGGSSSRGGGPSGEAILSQPLETINGKIKITQQGEVISDNFANSDLSETNLKIILSSVLEASLSQAPIKEDEDEWFTIMNYLSDESYIHYKKFISQDNFFDYLTKATPLEELAQMNIGSRPSKRRGGLKGIEDLRAIPWVFSWTQSRQIVPGWYGFGHSIEKAFNNGFKDKLKKMYKNFKFFRTLVSNIEMNLVKTDLNISRAYIENLYPNGMKIFEQIESEYFKAVKYLLEITNSNELLESNTTLKKTLAVRESYILPLNIFQLILLKKLRVESEDTKLLRRSLLLTINGISAGLKNTG